MALWLYFVVSNLLFSEAQGRKVTDRIIQLEDETIGLCRVSYRLAIYSRLDSRALVYGLLTGRRLHHHHSVMLYILQHLGTCISQSGVKMAFCSLVLHDF